MQHSKTFGGGAPLLGDFKIGATVVEGQMTIWLSTAAGTITDPAAATDMTDAFGVVVGAAEGKTLTYSTTQADTEGVATVVYDPLAIFRSRVVPSATVNTDYADADGYYLNNTTASAGGTLVSDTTVGGSNDDMNDGMCFAITGANAGESRIMTDMAANTSVTVTVPFDNAIAVGDQFLCSQYAPGVVAVQMTSDFTQADGTIAGGTGGEAVVVHVEADYQGHHGGDTTNPRLFLEFVCQDHAFNSVA